MFVACYGRGEMLLLMPDPEGVILVCSVVTCAECGDSAAAEPLLAPEHRPHCGSLEALVKTRCLRAKSATSLLGWKRESRMVLNDSCYHAE